MSRHDSGAADPELLVLAVEIAASRKIGVAPMMSVRREPALLDGRRAFVAAATRAGASMAQIAEFMGRERTTVLRMIAKAGGQS